MCSFKKENKYESIRTPFFVDDEGDAVARRSARALIPDHPLLALSHPSINPSHSREEDADHHAQHSAHHHLQRGVPKHLFQLDRAQGVAIVQ